ncbi:bestrophin family protein [Tautonia sociabilis]|uniref:Bestrophin n=1 Tax=Tautonia sociabilis TaxID=2080755 RepID=A0A432MQF5_9BACT|nr:bestrophin family ion channel [Tautonia sociabilis]RUL89479.1 hypothetical protein TsocGM_01520 [Tautonia sociabilis]
MKLFSRPQIFWREACTLDGSATPYVFQRILIFGGFAAAVAFVDSATGHRPEIEVAVAPYEVAGAALGLLLVLRTNAGYERWWEARKLWGGIVNRCRHLAVAALSYGPEDREWRREAIARISAFPQAARRALRGEDGGTEAVGLLGLAQEERIRAAHNRPLAVAQGIGRHLRSARGRRGLDGFAFLAADRDLTALLDYFGGCERIQKTPLPRAYAILIRRFIVPFLATLPFALLPKIGLLTPLATMLIAYPILALDKIGDDLQDPFSPKNLNHLPLDAICRTIECDLLGLLTSEEARAGKG